MQQRGTARPGGRTAQTRESVHTAVRAILADPRAGAPTVAAVALAAGVNAATIYRRWGTMEAVLLDIAVTDVNQHSPIQPTGDLEVDLRHWCLQLAGIGRPGGWGVFRAIAAAAAASPPGRDGLSDLRELVQPRLEEFGRILTASATTELEPEDLVNLVLAPIYVASILTPAGRVADGIDIDQIVDNVTAVRDHRRARTAPGQTRVTADEPSGDRQLQCCARTSPQVGSPRPGAVVGLDRAGS